MDYNLIVPFIPNLRRYARALVGDRDGADDLVQDTLERAVRKFHLWRPGDLRAWLFSIMHNVFVNQLKARKIAPEVEIDENMLAAPIPTATSVDIIDMERSLLALAPEARGRAAIARGRRRGREQRAGHPDRFRDVAASRGRERLRRLMSGESRSGLRVVQ